jgi:hypothetical protein
MEHFMIARGFETEWLLEPLRFEEKKGRSILVTDFDDDEKTLEVAIRPTANPSSRMIYTFSPVGHVPDLEKVIDLLSGATNAATSVAVKATEPATLPAAGRARRPSMDLDFDIGVTPAQERQILAFAKTLGIPRPVPIGMGLFSVACVVTPPQGRHWLSMYNLHNRPIPRRTRLQFGGDMARDRWELTHQPLGWIMFPNPEMFDGQTRLAAGIDEDRSVATVITFNVARSAAKACDLGRVRDLEDAARFYGISLEGSASIVTWTMRGYKKQSVVASRPSQLDFFDIHQEALVETVKQFAKFQHESFVSIAPVKAAVARAQYYVPKKVLQRFVAVFKSDGYTHEYEKIAVTLATALRRDRKQDAESLQYKYGLTTRAIDAFHRKTCLKNLRGDKFERFPFKGEAPLDQLPEKLAASVFSAADW